MTLELRNISYRVGDKTILDNIDIQVQSGEITAITGHNGGGKTTIAKVIAGLIYPTSGKIFFDGEDITEMSVTDRARAGIAYAFQQPVCFKGVTVRDILKAASGEDKLDALCGYLSRVGLCARDYIERPFDAKLSGGERKRIELASVLARRGKVNVFDEPEAGIDLWSFDSLVDLFTNSDSATVIITHQQKILDVADKIIVVNGGKVTDSGAGEEVRPRLKAAEVCSRLVERKNNNNA